MPTLLIAYDTQTGNTKKMAEAIGTGARSVKGVNVVVKKIWTKFFLEDLLEADAIILGSPTHYGDLTIQMEIFLKRLGKLDMGGKVGAAFGSFDNPEELTEVFHEKSVGILNKTMKSFGMNVVDEGLRMFNTPKKKELKVCQEWGRGIAKKISSKR